MMATRLGSWAGSLAGLGVPGRQSQLPAARYPGACQTAWTSQSSYSAKTATFRYTRAPQNCEIESLLSKAICLLQHRLALVIQKTVLLGLS